MSDYGTPGVVPPPNPYVGPRPIRTGEAYFGRETETRELYYLLNAERIVLLHSPSGAGKSSLIQAGLIPKLKNEFDVWHVIRVSGSPMGPGFNRYALSTMMSLEEELPEHLRRDPAYLAGLTLAQYVATRPRRKGAPPNIVLIFDQFEEVLTVDPLATAAKQEFFRQLGELLRDRTVWALFAIREDYLAPFDPYVTMVPTHLKNRFRINLLSLEAAVDDVCQLARFGGREFTDEAARQLIGDLAAMSVQQADGSFRLERGQTVEPVQMQVVCRRLWDAMPAAERFIRPGDLQQFGDVTKALGAYYDACVGQLARGDVRFERALREWFQERLITAGGIRGQVMQGAGFTDGIDNRAIAALLDTHLIRAEKRRAATWFELAHDRLIGPVSGSNAAWFNANLQEFQRRAALWEKHGQPEGLLLLGAELARAKQWRERTPPEERFLAASAARQAAIAADEAKTRRIRQFGYGAMACLVVALAGLAYGIWQGKETVKALGNAKVALKKADDEKEMRERSEKQRVDSTARYSWLGIAPEARSCDQSRIRSGEMGPGPRALYCQIEPLMSYAMAESLSGLTVFKSGPHGSAKLNLESQTGFGHYNGEFVRWARTNLLPGVRDRAFREETQALYNRYLKDIARPYYLALINLEKNPRVRNAMVQKHLAAIAHWKANPSETKWETQPGQVQYEQEFVPRLNRYGYATGMGVGFWIRRTVDGTFDEFALALRDLLGAYDREFLNNPVVPEG